MYIYISWPFVTLFKKERKKDYILYFKYVICIVLKIQLWLLLGLASLYEICCRLKMFELKTL
jgi:hypothetical protein